MKPYVEQLCEQIFKTYMVSSDRVKIEFDVDQIDLDISSVVPIGLIMNELITNSCKYAFTEQEDGQIKVSLKKEEQWLRLSIEDNGRGKSTTESSKGFGSRLIK